jgi:hypothetical protein
MESPYGAALCEGTFPIYADTVPVILLIKDKQDDFFGMFEFGYTAVSLV